MFRFSRYLLFLILLLAPGYLFAQVETARIEGTVRDTTGAVLPGVQITISHLETNRRITALANDVGRYVSVALPVGNYQVTAELPGFKTAVRRGIKLEVQQKAVIDLVLEVGEVTDRVEVVGDAPLLNASEPTQGQVIDNKRIVDLPLNGRDYVQLALLSAGTVQPVGGRYGGFSASGQRTTQNNYTIDGIDNNSLQAAGEATRGEAVKPSVDAIQEFKVVTNLYSAEFGRAAGGVLNLTIKSGGNVFHGTAFEFLRNEALDAKNFFDPPDSPKPPFKRNQFGFSLGGPILRDKTFFFTDYEGTRIRESLTRVITLPTAKMKAGDFSELGRTIFDPLTFDPDTGTRQPFPGNMIPEARIDPITRQVAEFYPDPQNSQPTRNFIFNPPNNENVDKFDVRIDHLFSDADNVYYRFSVHEQDLPQSPVYPGPGGLNPDFNNTGVNTGLVWNHTFSSHLVTSSRVGYNFIDTARTSPIETNFNRELGIKGVDQDLPGGFSQFVMSGFANVGLGPFTPIFSDSQVRQVSSDTTWIQGNHTVKMGYNFMALQQNNVNPQQRVGLFRFDGSFTRNPDGNVGGNALADFLLGLPFRTDFSSGIHIAGRGKLHAFYLQDDWKAHPKFTLNLGLRWEVFQPWVDKFNNIANFDIDTDPANPQLVLAREGGSRFDQALTATDTNNFGPRVGFAYQVRPGTVIRAGYGIFFANYEPVGDGRNIQSNPPFARIIRISTDRINPEIIVSEGIPAGILAPENMSDVRLTSLERRPSLPYSQQWSFNIQQELARDWLWEVGYFAAKANHLVYETNPNYALPGPGNVNSRRLMQGFIFPGTDVFVSPMAEVVRRGFNGNSNYHSLQTKIEKRFSTGFTLLGSYIWSRTIGDTCGFATRGDTPGCLRTGGQIPWNLRLERALDNQHRAHRFVINGIWQLPFGAGRRWGGNWSGLSNALLGGWAVAGIVNLTSGEPFGLTVRGDPANIGQGTRPNLIGDPERPQETNKLDEFFNTAAFDAPEPFTFGNLGRNALTGPGTALVDFATFKEFLVTEDVSVQFRFEAFNFFNTPNFALPGSTLGTGQFGQISGARRPRNLQFGLKILF